MPTNNNDTQAVAYKIGYYNNELDRTQQKLVQAEKNFTRLMKSNRNIKEKRTTIINWKMKVRKLMYKITELSNECC